MSALFEGRWRIDFDHSKVWDEERAGRLIRSGSARKRTKVTTPGGSRPESRMVSFVWRSSTSAHIAGSIEGKAASHNMS